MTAPSDRQPMSEDSNDEEHPCTFGRKESKANLFHSFSEHNVLKNYVCLVSNIPPFEYLSDQDARVDINHEQDNAIQVERSKALYDIKHYNGNDGTSCQHIEMMDVSENDDSNFISFDNPNILQYTRMKWLSDGSSGGTNARTVNALTGAKIRQRKERGRNSPSVSLTSCSTISSDFSQDSVLESQDSTDRCLSTILKLDEEHNMFGMTNMAIVGMPLRSGVRCEPLAARSCHHVPRCQPPSACCPYLMPCYWPARPNAPCPTPAHCFHNPPCPAARQRETPRDPNTSCPKL
ncbi:uncharacterized protein LOC125489914 [Plutella xylostella]|uniref:uncharacterized protein LOC125489914 n=1 Tax=Plutella xylostella TaxID=51655 RepID=UPI0020324BFD|nr:uncharacterized protein LOC125489914 [Plutella xylostella]